MVPRLLTLALLVCLAAGTSAEAQSPSEADKQVESLIRKLGSASFVQRESARKEIEAIGIPALEPLRRAKKTADVETTRRLATLIQLLEEQLLTQQILAPKEVHLKLENATAQQAIAELATLSGYPIQFQGDATKIANNKITLDTGKTTYWQALDQLCETAGLMERVDRSAMLQAPMISNGALRRLPSPIPGTMGSSMPAGPLVLSTRGSEKSFVSFAGAVKTEVRLNRIAGTKELTLQFFVSAEPGLLNTAIVGLPSIDTIFDEKSRQFQTIFNVPKVDARSQRETILMQFVDLGVGRQPAQGRIAEVRVKDAEQAAKMLKELTGKLTVQLERQNDVIARVEKILEASGKSATSSTGGTLKVLSVKRLGNGDYEVQVSMENLYPNPFGGNVVINGGNVIIRGNVNIQGMVIGPGGVRINGNGVNRSDLPDLLDAKGQRFKIASIQGESMNFVNGSSSRSATIVFQPSQGQPEPSELVLFGSRNHTISVPFRFENVPLP